jgi:hypothetical protein
MANRSTKVREIYDSSQDFLNNVLLELQAIQEDMEAVA